MDSVLKKTYAFSADSCENPDNIQGTCSALPNGEFFVPKAVGPGKHFNEVSRRMRK